MLLARRAVEPELGKWDLPGGFLEEGEEPLAGLRRELREETGLEVEPLSFLGAWVDTYGDGEGAIATLNLYWLARAAGEPHAADDVAELRWFAADELPELAFRVNAAGAGGLAEGGGAPCRRSRPRPRPSWRSSIPFGMAPMAEAFGWPSSKRTMFGIDWIP